MILVEIQLTKLDEFTRTKLKLNGKILDTHVLELDLPAFIIALWLLSLLGRNRFKKMIGLVDLSDRYSSLWNSGYCTSCHQLIVYSAELDEPPRPIKRRQLRQCLHLKKCFKPLLDLMDRGVIVYNKEMKSFWRESLMDMWMIWTLLYEYGFEDQVSCPVNSLWELWI